MDRDQDVEVELYEENVGNLNYSTPTESRSSSSDRFPLVLSTQKPTQRTQLRLEEIPFVAIDPRPDPEDLSDAPTSQVPRIHDSCHSGARMRGPGEDFTYQRLTSIPKAPISLGRDLPTTCIDLGRGEVLMF